MLHDWQTIPGTNEEDQVDPQALKSWVATAREACRKLDRIEVCDLTLGELFAKSPSDTDGAPPLVAIREVIEECQSEEITRGLATGYFNLRGGFSKGIYEGGDQERKLAADYQRYADACSHWPRTAAVHRQMAKNYLADAAREDERAQARD